MSDALPVASPHAIRDELTEMVVNDLLGRRRTRRGTRPAGGPRHGSLPRRDARAQVHPRRGRRAGYARTDEQDDAETGATDASTPPTATLFPNSIGMSFLVDGEAEAILIKTEWAGTAA